MTALAKNSDYWAKRAVENENNSRTTAQAGKDEIEKIFLTTRIRLQKEIEYWWYRFAKNNGLTVAEAKKLMTKKELDELNWDVEEYIRKGIEAAITQVPYVEKQLENASAKFHISRLNALKIQVLSICNELFTDTNKTVKECMKKVYEETYYKTAYNIQTGIGVYSNFSKIDENLLEKIISKPWADDGSNFSERIWGKYRPQLVNRIHKDLIDCVSRGRNPNEYSEALAKDFKVSLKQTGDLMLSEYNYFNEQATQDCLNELDVEEYEILGTLDGVTCATCGGLDGKHYPLKDVVIGVNSPPFHPRCRCTTIPYFDDEFTENEERAYRGEDGKTHYTKAKTYEEWKREFVKEKGQDAWNLYEKGAKYRNSDNEQYQNYKDILGKNAPESLEEFQKIKYTDNEEWEDLKYYYRNINDRPIEYVKIDRDLEKAGILNRGKAFPLEDVELNNWNVHAENRLKQRNISKKEAIEYKNSALLMMKKYPEPNTQNNYYSEDGVIGIRISDKTVCTTYSKDDFKSDTLKILEVAKKWLK